MSDFKISNSAKKKRMNRKKKRKREREEEGESGEGDVIQSKETKQKQQMKTNGTEQDIRKQEGTDSVRVLSSSTPRTKKRKKSRVQVVSTPENADKSQYSAFGNSMGNALSSTKSKEAFFSPKVDKMMGQEKDDGDWKFFTRRQRKAKETEQELRTLAQKRKLKQELKQRVLKETGVTDGVSLDQLDEEQLKRVEQILGPSEEEAAEEERREMLANDFSATFGDMSTGQLVRKASDEVNSLAASQYYGAYKKRYEKEQIEKYGGVVPKVKTPLKIARGMSKKALEREAKKKAREIELGIYVKKSKASRQREERAKRNKAKGGKNSAGLFVSTGKMVNGVLMLKKKKK